MERMKTIGLGWDEIDTAAKDKIYQLIIEHTRENHCCRVGWACHHILGRDVQENVLDKLAARVVKTAEFVKESSNINFKYDWNITKNPARSQNNRNSLFGLMCTIIGVILGAFLQMIPKYIQPKTLETKTVILPKIQIVHDTIYIERSTTISKNSSNSK